MKTCTACKAVIPSDATACQKCGKHFADAELQAMDAGEATANKANAVGCGILLLISVLVYASCDISSSGSGAASDLDRRVTARVAVQSMLRDPDSAEFTGFRVQGRVVCGYVNARNGFGGMTGPQRFIYRGYAEIEEASSSGFSERWARLCR